MDIVFHFPPDLFNLLAQTIPRLCRSKDDVILFFKGAGVSSTMTSTLVRQLNKDRESISKYKIAKTVLQKLNEKGEVTLRERREILRRVIEFEEFSTCWPNDLLAAQGLVAQVRQLVNIKDSFTRMNQEREEERRKRLAEQTAKQKIEEQRHTKLLEIRNDLLSLFGESNRHQRGKALEGILNRLFEANEILVREAFTISGEPGEGIIEQIDGVIELNGEIYLVEMKWWNQALGPGDVAQHISRLFLRGEARGLFISASGYTPAAIKNCQEALQQKVLALCSLEEIVLLLEKEQNFKDFLKAKIQAAVIHKNPFYEPLKFGVGANG